MAKRNAQEKLCLTVSTRDHCNRVHFFVLERPFVFSAMGSEGAAARTESAGASLAVTSAAALAAGGAVGHAADTPSASPKAAPPRATVVGRELARLR